MPGTFNLFLFGCAILCGSAAADDFTDLSDSFGVTTTLVGTHQSATNDANGFAINFWQSSFEGGLAANAALSNPHNVQADAFGNVYIADNASHSILIVTAGGAIYTFAGTHSAGFNGDGPAPATSLQVNNPNGLYVFPSGVVYLLDPGNHRIRRVGTDGIMTTVVNDPDPNWYPSGRGLWVSSDEQLIYYTNEYAPVPPSIVADGAAVKRWTPSGGIEIVCSKASGFRNPANLEVNPIDHKLYVCDRAEDDPAKVAIGLWRIDGTDLRARITGNINDPAPVDGQPALTSFIDQPRGLAFLPDGSYFLCGHKDGNIWHVDTAGLLHRYIRGRGSKDYYNLTDGLHPPLTGFAPNGQEWFSQPRAVSIAPDGNLLVVCSDSGFVFKVNRAAPRPAPADFHATRVAADAVRLQWTGVFGRGYIVQRAWDSPASAWQTLGATGGDAATIQFADTTVAGHSAAFYRLAPAL
jgi:WD40 repeat protein